MSLTKKTKLLFLSDVFLQPSTGLRRYASCIFLELNKYFEIIPYSCKGNNHNENFYTQLPISEVNRGENILSIKVLGIKIPWQGRYLTNLVSKIGKKNKQRKKTFSFVCLKALREFLRLFVYLERHLEKRIIVNSNNLIVVFSPYEKIPEYLQRDNVLMVQMLHDIVPIRFPEFCGSQKSFFRAWESLQKADLILVNSKFTMDDALDFHPKLSGREIGVTLLGVSPRFDYKQTDEIKVVKEKLGIKENDSYILALSTIEPRKNLPFLISCWNKIRKSEKIKNIKLVIAGRKGWGGVWDEIKVLIEENQRNDILQVGPVKDEYLPMLYAGCLFSVYPSKYEGFGLPILESMACGKFCLSSNKTSMPEIIGNELPMFDPYDEEDLISKISLLMNNRRVLEDFSRKAYERSKTFSWESTGEKTAKLIKEAFEKKHSN